MIINLLFSMDGPRLDDDQSSAFAKFGQWVVLNERNERLYVDAVGEHDDITDAMDALAAYGRNPTVIGGWAEDGSMLPDHPLDLNAYLDVAPDDVTFDADGNESGRTRPTTYVQTHGWAGWADRVIP